MSAAPGSESPRRFCAVTPLYVPPTAAQARRLRGAGETLYADAVCGHTRAGRPPPASSGAAAARPFGRPAGCPLPQGMRAALAWEPVRPLGPARPREARARPGTPAGRVRCDAWCLKHGVTKRCLTSCHVTWPAISDVQVA